MEPVSRSCQIRKSLPAFSENEAGGIGSLRAGAGGIAGHAHGPGGDGVAQPRQLSTSMISITAGHLGAFRCGILGLHDVDKPAGFSRAGFAGCGVDGFDLGGLDGGDLLAESPSLHAPSCPAGQRGGQDGGQDVRVDQARLHSADSARHTSSATPTADRTHARNVHHGQHNRMAASVIAFFTAPPSLR
jgi:hypothetical protein